MVLLWPETRSMDLLTLTTFMLFLMPGISSAQYVGNNLLTHRKIFPKQEALTSYAVIFDAGSTGSRLHVFHFDQNLALLHIGKDIELYDKVAANYLLGKLGKTFSKTVGVVDLGGGPLQMAYAVSHNTAKNAPKVPDEEDPYIKKLVLKGKKYDLYVHSYLHYGREASRAEILKVIHGSPNPCILAGFDGTYTYSGVEYKAAALSTGADFDECRETDLKALKVNESCPYKNCTFDGIWNGGGGSGQKNLVLPSSFYYVATEVDFVDINKPNAKVHPGDYEIAVKQACGETLEKAKSSYPHSNDKKLPYVCLDLTYQYTLLVDGFGLDPCQEITVSKLDIRMLSLKQHGLEAVPYKPNHHYLNLRD